MSLNVHCSHQAHYNKEVFTQVGTLFCAQRRCKIMQVLVMEPVGKGEDFCRSAEEKVWGRKSDSIVEEKGDVWDNRDFYLLKPRQNSLDQH